MKLYEAIRHCEEVVEAEKEKLDTNYYKPGSLAEQKCRRCIEEHEQLAEWLNDYKRMKEAS